MCKNESNSITLHDFYKELPLLHQKYQSSIELMNALYCEECSYPDFYKTDRIVVIASKSCIDSIVNLNALKCIEANTSIKIEIIVDEDYAKRVYPNERTPYIIGYSKSRRILWAWERAPNSIKRIEKGDDQMKVIVEKRNYRSGLYIKDTLKEIVNLL